MCLLSLPSSLGVLRETRKLYHGVFWGPGLKTVGRLPLPLQDTHGLIFSIELSMLLKDKKRVRRFLGSGIVSLHVPVQLVSNEATEFGSTLRAKLEIYRPDATGNDVTLTAFSRVIATCEIKSCLFQKIGRLLS